MLLKRRNDNKPYLSNEDLICSLAVLEEKEKNVYTSVYYKAAVGQIKEYDGKKYIKDSLDEAHRSYLLIEDDTEVEKMIRYGDLKPKMPFCYSLHDGKSYNFKKIYSMKTKDEITNYLIEYNKLNHTNLYWTFMDSDELKEVDKIAEENRKMYSLL